MWIPVSVLCFIGWLSASTAYSQQRTAAPIAVPLVARECFVIKEFECEQFYRDPRESEEIFREYPHLRNAILGCGGKEACERYVPEPSPNSDALIEYFRCSNGGKQAIVFPENQMRKWLVPQIPVVPNEENGVDILTGSTGVTPNPARISCGAEAICDPVCEVQRGVEFPPGTPFEDMIACQLQARSKKDIKLKEFIASGQICYYLPEKPKKPEEPTVIVEPGKVPESISVVGY